MKFRNTLVVLGLAIILGGWVYFHEIRGSKQSAERKAQAGKLLGVDAAQVAAVRITHTGTQFDLEKRSGTWYLIRPLPAPCDPRVIGAFLDTLAAARREDEVGRGDLVRYGLDAPAAQVEIDAGGKTRKLAFGRINPLQTLVYVLVDDSKQVVLTTSSLLTASLNSAFEWRDKRMIQVEPESVERLTFRTLHDGELSIRRDPQFGWRVEGPVPWRVDPVRVRSTLQDLAGLDAVGVAAENKANAGNFGVDTRRFGAQVEVAGGRVVGDLVLGWVDHPRSAYFAIVPDKPEVFRVDRKAMDNWVALVHDPRDHQALTPFLGEKITRIRVQSTDDRFELRRRSATDWKVVSSTKVDSMFAIATGAVDGALTDLATMRVADFPDHQPADGMFAPPTMQVLLFEGDKQVAGLEVGLKDPHGIYVFARGPGEPAAFLLSPADLLRLPYDLDRLGAEPPAPEASGGD